MVTLGYLLYRKLSPRDTPQKVKDRRIVILKLVKVSFAILGLTFAEESLKVSIFIHLNKSQYFSFSYFSMIQF